jgi:DNA uptake protein ComE-like DNA-binding protein
LATAALLALGCAAWAPAQEDETPAKKPIPKALQEAKAKAREKKVTARAKADADAKARAVDINHASKEELKKLPGITDAYADAIVANRPYKTKADLVIKKAIPLDLFQVLRKLVAAK